MSKQTPSNVSRLLEINNAPGPELSKAYWEFYSTIEDEENRFRPQHQASEDQEVYNVKPNDTERGTFESMYRIFEDAHDFQDALTEFHAIAQNPEERLNPGQSTSDLEDVSDDSPYDSVPEMYSAVLEEAADRIEENTTLL